MKRILFVDDEPELLRSLQARLYKHRKDWDMVFVDSGAAALAALQQHATDLIVTDIRMPGMDGGQLLKQVRERWPETIRLVLSGYAEQSQMLRLVALAHQYLSKPCDAQQLENVIERCFRLHDLLRQDKLRSIVGRIGSLPTMPKVYAQLQQALAEPNTSSAALADIVAHDAVIATKVLQVANSAFFRLAKPMTRIKDAVAYLGFGSIRNLVMTAEIFSKWQDVPEAHGLSVEQLQTHALTTAAACMALADKTPLADDAWLTGLVHDIGYWILIQECPKELDQALQLSRAEGIPSYLAEQQVIGATHAEVGAYLLGLWGLPYPLVEAVALHHTPQAVAQHGFDLLGILAVAHSLLDPNDPQMLQLSSELQPIVDVNYFTSLAPPFDWQEATHRVQASRVQPIT